MKDMKIMRLMHLIIEKVIKIRKKMKEGENFGDTEIETDIVHKK